MALIERRRREPNRLNRIGAGLFVLWGVIHVAIGGMALLDFVTAGPAEMFTQAELRVDPGEMDATLRHLGNIVAEYYVNIVGLGLLGIILGVTLVWENDPLGFWIALLVLGLADAAFLVLEILPGYQPLVPPVLGPIIFVLGLAFAGAGLRRG